MFSKLFNLKSTSVTSAAIVVASFTVFGSLLGIFRNSLLAANFGASSELDIYYAAFRVPDFIYGIFYLGVVSVLFLPIFNDLYSKDSDKAWRFFGAMINWIIIILGVGSLILFFAAPVVMRYIVPGFEPDQVSIVVKMTRLMLIQPIILGASNIISGTLQSFERFAAASFGHISYNIGIILSIIISVPKMGVVALAWGVVFGALLHLLVQLPSLIRVNSSIKLRLKPDFEIIRPYLGLIPPRILNVISNQINIFAVTILASMASSGSLAVFSLANDIQVLPQTVIAISFAIAAFPTLSKLAFNDRERFIKTIESVIRKIIFWLIPTSLLVIVFRAQIVRLILGYGRFDWEATILTLDTLLIFGVGILFQGLIPFLVRIFFALHNTLTPFIAALLGNIITITLGILLLPDYGVKGLAVAVVIASIVNVAVLYAELIRTRLVGGVWFIKYSLLILVLSSIGSISGKLWLRVFERAFDNSTVIGLALQTIASGACTLIILGILFSVFRVREFNQFISGVKKKLRLSK